jgi:outer membrane receptor protein involved in Fe transport
MFASLRAHRFAARGFISSRACVKAVLGEFWGRSMKSRYMISCAAVALLSGTGGAVADTPTAASATVVETVVVTAERRSEDVQRVPMTLQAFSGDSLEQLNVNTLDDILKYLPNVTYGNNGPGQGEIFMRGLSNGFRGNQSTGTVGLYPNVAIYLDEESMQFPARNVDIYMVDMQRVEVLEGPQGTLFGGGAEAGAVRYITNKPDVTQFSASAQAMGGLTDGGAPNSAFNAVVNVPVIDNKLAVRAVVYYDHEGGYINNVPSTFTRSDLDPGNILMGIAPNGMGICPDGHPVGPAGCTVAGAPVANNAALVRNNQNPLLHEGARVSAQYDIDDDWNVLISESLQRLDAEGLSVEYPIGSDFQTLKPRQVTAFSPSYNKDSYASTAWTVNGKIGDLSAIYTGGWTVRNVNQQMEYTNYTRTYYGVYYSCTGGVQGPGGDNPFGQGNQERCYSPVTNWHDSIRNTHLSEEGRLSTPSDWRLRGLVGAYWEQFRIYDVMNFNYKTIPECTPANILAAAVPGGPACSGDVATFPGAFANQPGVRPPMTAFGEDTQRGYDQTALFGSVDFDIIPGTLTATAGTRWFEYREFELGSVYSTASSRCQDVPVCAPKGANNIDANNDHKTFSGFKSRAVLTWNIDDDDMAYYLFSQGYRPGGFNRRVKDVLSDGSGNSQFATPNSYSPDSLENQEIGVKSELFDRRLLLNLSAYHMRWNHVQFLLFQPLFTGNQTFAINGPDYNIDGVELQAVARATDELTFQGATSYNENTEAKAPCLKGNIPGNPSFNQCITTAQVGGSLVNFPNPFGVVGGIAAFSPKWQGNLRAQYERRFDDFDTTTMVGMSYTGGQFNQPANYVSGTGVLILSTTYLRYFMPGYVTFDASFTVSMDKWTAEIFAENLGNNHASTFTSSAQWWKSEVPLRPRTVGLKVGLSY